MAFVPNKFQQLNAFDKTINMTEREKKFLRKSWAHAFSEHVFPHINEDRFAVLYSDNPASRPNTPVNILISMELLKELQSLSDDDVLEAVILDPRYQYALHTTSFAAQPVSDRSLSRFRARLYEYELATGRDLIKEEMEDLAQHFADMMEISGLKKRMDSLMVSSSCKNMSRLKLIYTVVANMVKAIERTGELELLDKGLRKYLNEDNKNNTIYRTASSDAPSKLEQVANDAVTLMEILGDAFAELKEHELLARVVAEQIERLEDGWKLRENKDITTRSLQNPSDEDASYRVKAGEGHQGYVGNFVESYDDNGAIITGMDYQQNVHSDAEFAESVLLEEEGDPENPVSMIADGAYGSDELMDLAKERNVNLVTTSLVGKAPDPVLADYEVDEEKQTIDKCPAGQAPLSCKYKADKDSYYAHFDKAICSNCPLRAHCGVTMQKKRSLVQLSMLTVRRARYVKKLGTEEYKKLARQRNAVEAIPSVLRRKYNIDRIPVRGYVRSKMRYFFKIGAMNVKRVADWQNSQSFLTDFSHFYFFLKFGARNSENIACLLSC